MTLVRGTEGRDETFASASGSILTRICGVQTLFDTHDVEQGANTPTLIPLNVSANSLAASPATAFATFL